jgi:chemotaxis protein CheC
VSPLSADRREALQELINIGFGRSAAALAELLGAYIVLSVPEVELVRSSDLMDMLFPALDVDDEVSLVKQSFQGDFLGEAVLALSSGSAKGLVMMLTEQAGFQPDMELGQLEIEALLEVGNLVIGACLGQFADLLHTTLTFNPPVIQVERYGSLKKLDEDTSHPGQALLIKTQFKMSERQATGFLLIFLLPDRLDWLFREVDNFMEQAFA